MALIELGFDDIPAKFLSKLAQKRKEVRKLFGHNSQFFLTPRRIVIQFDKEKAKGDIGKNILDILMSVEYKTMRWKDAETKFVRPLRWILALDGDQITPIEIFGVKSDRKTFPHRTLEQKPIEIQNENEYFEKIKKEGKVEISHIERARKIGEFLKEKGISPDDYRELFEMAVFSTENPSFVEGEINQSGIPPKIAEDILVEQVFVFPKKQKTKKEGEEEGEREEEKEKEKENKKRNEFEFKNPKEVLKEYIGEEVYGFIAVIDNPSPDIDVVREGYKFVIDSRFDDARFYIKEDEKMKFSERIHLLENIVYNEKFGSFYDRSVFMSKICDFIQAKLGISSRDVLRRATMLCKADLTTGLIREFPEHQGYIGMIYALKDGESESISSAIYEHKIPEKQDDPLPKTEAGVILSLADKLIHIFISFITSLEVTSEEDPFGIRRAARNAIRLMIERKIDISLQELAEFIIPFFDEHMREKGMKHEEIVEKIGNALSFIQERVEFFLSENFPKDIVRGVLQRTFSPYDAYLRAKSLSETDFSSMFYVARRVRNIIEQAMKKGIFEILEDIPTPQNDAEKKLLEATLYLQEKHSEYMQSKEYEKFIKIFDEIKPVVDEFFNSVMVLTDNEYERKTRLTILYAIHSITDDFADFSLIEKR